MKKILIIAVIVLVVAAAAIYVFVIAPANKKNEEVRNMPIGEVDLSRIPDGSYEGNFTYGSFTYAIQVGVKDHNIEKVIIIENRDSKYAGMAEGVVERVIEKQTPNVEVVTGATTTSKALLKAIENALNSALAEQ